VERRGGGGTRRRGDAAAGDAAAVWRGGGLARRRTGAAADRRGGGQARRWSDAARRERSLVVSTGLRSRSRHRVGRFGVELGQLEPLVLQARTEPVAMGYKRPVQEQVAEASEDDQGAKSP
jgi:hypothetical protein